LPSTAAFCRAFRRTARYNSGAETRAHPEIAMAEPTHDAAPSVRTVEDRPNDRLDSWKEIATYLNRDISTVQRWEKREGMPVHRHLHDSKGSVYASRAELDEWMGSPNLQAAQRNEDNATSDIPPTRPPAPPISDAASRGSNTQAVAGPGSKRWKLRPLWLLLAACVAFITAIGIWLRHQRTSAPTPIHSLAVLPLKNLSGDPAQEYLADGMTEEVIGRLSMIRGLRVISRTSSIAIQGHKPFRARDCQKAGSGCPR
jgi:hypothetical protein